jgi:hypothetical protein
MQWNRARRGTITALRRYKLSGRLEDVRERRSAAKVEPAR